MLLNVYKIGLISCKLTLDFTQALTTAIIRSCSDNDFKIFFPYFHAGISMGPAGFEPATSSARGWHPSKLDNGPKEAGSLDSIRIICLLIGVRDRVVTPLLFRTSG
jgi:hypothetical protein